MSTTPPERPRYGEYGPVEPRPVEPAPVEAPVARPVDAAYPQYAPYAGSPGPGQPFAVAPLTRRRTVGVIALVASLVALIGGLILSTFVAQGMAPYMGAAMDGTLDPDTMSSDELATFTAISAGITGALLFGTAFGLWGLIQGIVATVRRSGRAFGVAAIVIAVAAPVICVIAFYAVILTSVPLEVFQR